MISFQNTYRQFCTIICLLHQRRLWEWWTHGTAYHWNGHDHSFKTFKVIFCNKTCRKRKNSHLTYKKLPKILKAKTILERLKRCFYHPHADWLVLKFTLRLRALSRPPGSLVTDKLLLHPLWHWPLNWKTPNSPLLMLSVPCTTLIILGVPSQVLGLIWSFLVDCSYREGIV